MRLGSRQRDCGLRHKDWRSTHSWRRPVLTLSAAACSSGWRGTRTRKAGLNGWRKAAFWCGASRRAQTGCASVLLAPTTIWCAFAKLLYLSQMVRPAGSAPGLNFSNHLDLAIYDKAKPGLLIVQKGWN